MKKKYPITGRQPLYAMLKWPIYIGLYFFYRKYKIKGFKNIPRNKPLIFAINHQNAFLDPLVVAPLSHFKQITFMLRASIYNNKRMRPFLRGLNLMPVYRQSDGLSTMDKNTEIFENCIYLLKKKRPLFIFPEGTHNDKRSIRPAKKGLMRIALIAEERNDFNLNICIVPVGVNYSDPYNFGSDLLINIGKPIDVVTYKDLYLKNPAAVMNQLRIEVDQAMRDLAIDIQADEIYDEVETARDIMVNEKYKTKHPTLHDTFNESKKIIKQVENYSDKNWVGHASEYKKLIGTLNIRDYMMQPSYRLKNGWLYLPLFILFSPVFLIGSLANLLPFKLPVILSDRMVSDPVFRSSIIFGIALFLFPIYYLTIYIAVTLSVSWKCGLLVTGVCMISGFISLFYIRKWKKYRAWLQLGRFKKLSDKNYLQAVELRKKMVDFFTHAV
ncbi:MAG: 1-acyl-sn-glycerol-3-phosphate acyltransferase [Flavobacteriales bacterium]